ncbi:MAG: hypothetical protein JSV66_18180 [Trueperaceae bacterium]|nr:MAG: hypothetical protein JSV66_18180 [Trueperaceae bacterium]
MMRLVSVRHLTVLALATIVSATLAQDLTIQMELGVDRKDRPIIITEITDAAGEPARRRQVDYYFIPDFFPNRGGRLHGSHPVYLGSATTNLIGAAEFRYTPPYSGTALFEARVEGSRDLAGGSAQLEAEVLLEESPVPELEPVPLAAIRRPLEIGILSTVIGVWLFLLLLTLTTIRRINRLGRGVTG